jgi:hypothetical protein
MGWDIGGMIGSQEGNQYNLKLTGVQTKYLLDLLHMLNGHYA